MRALVATAAVLAIHCGRAGESRERPGLQPIEPEPRSVRAGPSAAPAVTCRLDGTYPGMWHVAEASAATEFAPRPGERAVIALSDSDNHGEAMIWTFPAGPLRQVHLELDTVASDDIEGAAWTGGHLYTLTSSGAVRRYSPAPSGELVRDRTAYPIGAPPYVCEDLHEGNCGKNYEGLCLRPLSKPSRCAGYAASKAKGALYCLVWKGEALAIDPIKPPIVLDVRKNALSDCAFGSEGGPAEATLVVTTNIYGGSTTYVVDEATFALAPVDVPGLPNNEAVAVDKDGALYQFMDGDTSVSPTYRATCTGWASSPAPAP